MELQYAVSVLSGSLIDMKLVLAPTRGLVDDVVYGLPACIGDSDECVGELVRIIRTVHSRQTWFRYVPEITNGSKAFAGTPCTVQPLGSDADDITINILEAMRFGADEIDLSFDRPTPTVDRHKGGAVLLKEPELIYHIVRTLRRRLLPHIPLTTKMRLGYGDKDSALECAAVITAADVYVLTIHARTKNEDYEPPVHREWIRKVHDSVDIPVTTNGDAFTLEDHLEIKTASSCDSVTLGRGAVIRLYFVRQIKQCKDGHRVRDADFAEISGWINLFFDLCTMKEVSGKYPVTRSKQWLGMMKKEFAEVQELSDAVGAVRNAGRVKRILSAFGGKMSVGQWEAV